MMRTLTITTTPDWQTLLRQSGKTAELGLNQGTYQGEILNFATPGAFFGQLSEKRWSLINLLLRSGRLGLRELSRRAGRDVKGVSNDCAVLLELGLIEKDEKGALTCPFDTIHIDMKLAAMRPAA